MLPQSCTDAGIESINTSRRQAYGVNAHAWTMKWMSNFHCTPHKKNFSMTQPSNDFDADGTLELDDMYSQLDGFASSIYGLENVSPSVLHGIMVHRKASDRQSILNLRHDDVHRHFTELRKILEDAHCPNYMLQKVLQWAYIAKLDGFEFNLKATTRKANIDWMYQYSL
jgi:hypothetical protein